jgi:hypothetical protein
VHNDIKPTILTVEDANDYSESLKMQRADIELRLNILSGLQATESYIGDSNTYATELELSSHTSQTTSAHGGITPSSHIGSGGNQHALAIPNGDAGFISGADLAKLRNLTTIDTSKFVTTDQVGNGQNQIPRLDGVGELPDVNIGNLDGGTF